MPIRRPIPVLRPFVETLWVSDVPVPTDAVGPYREYALPSGGMHLVIRLSDDPIRLIDDTHPSGRDYGHAVIGGARSSYYVRDIAAPVHSMGATLLPGAAEALFNISAAELAERHTRLDEIWGYQVIALRERLLEAKTPAQQLDLFESFLLSRMPRIRGMHPAVAQSLAQLRTTNVEIDRLAVQSGYSHRRFIELFRHSVGLTPKLYSRVLRFQKVIGAISATPASWVEVAVDAGYSDQAHFNREFREFSGMTPAEYKKIAPLSPSHVKK